MKARVPARLAAFALLALFAAPARAGDRPPDGYAIRPADYSAVTLTDAFWAPRLAANRAATIPGNLTHLDATGSTAAFAILAGRTQQKYRGYMWGDSDVYKTIEGIAHSLRTHPDPALEKRMEEIVAHIVAAQADDGYLFPHIQIAEPRYARFTDETTRTCESYSIGHLLESAVAHHRATGRTEYLQAARRAADLIVRVQAEGKLEQISGHPEIELGLVKLYQATGERKYLDAAARYVRNARRLASRAWSGGRPFLADGEARGHAVAAVYLYAAATDVAALTADAELMDLVQAKWRSVVERKMYLTGGIGLPRGEAFGADYDLPNASAYAETCAAIAHVLWNHRLFLATGEARFLDVLERALYNGVLAGLDLSGDKFFYPNPLQADGRRRFNHGANRRVGWFGCPCCPVNLVRVIPQAPGLLYATTDDSVYVNLFAAGRAELPVGSRKLTLTQETKYPWDGRVKISVDPGGEPAEFTLRVRVPGWALGQPVPGDLYRYVDTGAAAPRVALKVNGRPAPLAMEKGFALLRRRWNAGDRIQLDLPMPVRRVLAHDAVKEDAGKVALQRGPIVYCLEGADHGGKCLHLVLPDDAPLRAEHRSDLLGGLTVLRARGQAVHRGDDGKLATAPVELTAVPYYAWNHRGPGPMAVWLPRTSERAQPLPPLTLAGRAAVTASHCWHADTIDAANDSIEPPNSHDLTPPCLTWWNHKGTKEWVQYDWPEAVNLSSSAVYWFDDRATGGCRVPASWRLLYRDGDQWKPVRLKDARYGLDLDRYNSVAFEPVTTRTLRLEVQLQEKWSGGLLEWKVK